MPNLKDIKDRIKNIQTAEKVTLSMKSIAVAKLAKARKIYKNTESYFSNSHRVLNHILCAYDQNRALNTDSVSSTFFNENKKLDNLIVSIGSDRGLCGGFNINVTKQTQLIINKYKQNSENIKLICFGSKVKNHFKSGYKNNTLEIEKFDHNFDLRTLEVEKINLISKFILNLFENNEVGSLTIIYTKFISAVESKVEVVELLPILNTENLFRNNKLSLADINLVTDEYIEEATHFIIKDFINYWLLKSVINSLISEHASRVTAMENASTNASELLSDLKLEYNRTRQSLITKELIEIISGAEAT